MRFLLSLLLCGLPSALPAADVVERPFRGITHITRTETSPRPLHIHVVIVDLEAPGIAFKLTEPGGPLETMRQTTLDFLCQERAQAAVNAHFFLPFPAPGPAASLVGFAASGGLVFSAFEAPVQSYAIVSFAPALNIDRANRASIVHRDPAFPDGKHVLEPVELWTAVSGSAQIVTGGVKTIPGYRDARHPAALLTPGGPRHYANSQSWYDALNARTAIGLSRDRRQLFLFTVDARGGSAGVSVPEVAGMLIADYGVFDALNLDGGGSTTLAMEDPGTHWRRVRNVPSGGAARAVGSNLAIFAIIDP